MTEVHIGKTLLTTLINFLTLPAYDVAKADAMEALGALTHGNVDTFQAYMARNLISEGRMTGGLFDADPYTVTEYGVQFLLDLIAKARAVAFSETDAGGEGVASAVLDKALQEEAERAAYLKTPMGMSATEVSLMYPPLGNTELARVGVQGNLKYVPGEPGHHNLFMLVCFVVRAERYKADPELSEYQQEAAVLLSKLDEHQAARRARNDALNIGYQIDAMAAYKSISGKSDYRLDRVLSEEISGKIPVPSEDGIVLNEEQLNRLQFTPYQRMSIGHMLWAPAFKFDFRTRASRRLLENGLFRDLQKEHGANARAKAKAAIAELVKRYGRKVVVSQHHTTLHLLNNQKVSPPEEFVQPVYKQLKALDWDEKELVPTLDTIQQKKDYLTLWANYAGCNDLFEKMMEKIETMPEEEQKSNLDLIITTLNKGEQEPDNSQDHIPARLTRYDYATTGNANMPDVTFRANDSGGVNVYTTRDAQHTDETLLCVVERSQSGRFVAYPSTAIDMDLHQKLMLIADTSYSVLQAQILTLVFKNEPYHLYNRAVEPNPASGGR